MQTACWQLFVFRSFNGSSEPGTPLHDESIPSKPLRPLLGNTGHFYCSDVGGRRRVSFGAARRPGETGGVVVQTHEEIFTSNSNTFCLSPLVVFSNGIANPFRAAPVTFAFRFAISVHFAT
jgi:hypothetical protein